MIKPPDEDKKVLIRTPDGVLTLIGILCIAGLGRILYIAGLGRIL